MFLRRTKARVTSSSHQNGTVISLFRRTRSASVESRGFWPWEEEPAAEPRSARRVSNARRMRRQPWS